MRILCLPAKGCPFFQQLAYHGHLTDNCLINTVIPETTTRGEWMIRGQRWPILPTVRERRAPNDEIRRRSGEAPSAARSCSTMRGNLPTTPGARRRAPPPRTDAGCRPATAGPCLDCPV